MIYGERVEQAREFHGLTQKDFSERLGCDQSMVAKIESGIQPSGDLAKAIASETGFPIGWFERQPLTHFPMGTLQFRARASMSSKQRRQAYQHARTAYELVDLMIPRLKPIPVRLPRLGSMEIEEAAVAVRSECGLSPDTPIAHLFDAVERAGAIVVALPTSLEKRDGFSGWAGAAEQRPIIHIPSGAPGDRVRWTTAHELGELVLSSLPPGPERERSADRFAADFLLPAVAMKREMKSPLSLTTLAKLKARWGVAMSAIARRGRDLDIISERQYRYLLQQMGARKWRTNEPVEIAIEKPRAIRKMVEVLYGDPIDFRALAHDSQLSPLYLREFMRAHATRGERSRARVVPDSTPLDDDGKVVLLRRP